MQYRESIYDNPNTNVELFKIIDNLIDRKISKLKFNSTVEGTIKSCNTNGSYEVYINGGVSTIYATEGMRYNAGEVVLIEVLHNNYSFKYIKCKKPIIGV